jgi:hypothetical protein
MAMVDLNTVFECSLVKTVSVIRNCQPGKSKELKNIFHEGEFKDVYKADKHVVDALVLQRVLRGD